MIFKAKLGIGKTACELEFKFKSVLMFVFLILLTRVSYINLKPAIIECGYCTYSIKVFVHMAKVCNSACICKSNTGSLYEK